MQSFVPPVIPKKLSQKLKESSSNVYSCSTHCGFTPPLARHKGRGQTVWAVWKLAFFDIVQWKDWNKDSKDLHLCCKKIYYRKLFVIS